MPGSLNAGADLLSSGALVDREGTSCGRDIGSLLASISGICSHHEESFVLYCILW